MKNVTSHQGKLEIIKSLPVSKNGNPRYLVRVDSWTCRTGVDSHLGYLVVDLDGKDVKATIGTHYTVATLDSIQEL